jgi:hypothetical protein
VIITHTCHLCLLLLLLLTVQVLRARQSELESQPQPHAALKWQRSCMPSLLALADVTANLLSRCNGLAGRQSTTAAATASYAAGQAGTSWRGGYQQQQQQQQQRGGVSASSGVLGALPAVVNELREGLRQMVGLAGSWLKAGVLAVCGLASSAGATSSSGRQSTGGAAAGVSSGGVSAAGVDCQDAQMLLQVRFECVDHCSAPDILAATSLQVDSHQAFVLLPVSAFLFVRFLDSACLSGCLHAQLHCNQHPTVSLTGLHPCCTYEHVVCACRAAHWQTYRPICPFWSPWLGKDAY